MQDDAYEPIIETGIPCFRCGERSGLDCPGRKPDEPTLCEPCFKKHMAEEMERQAKHQASYLEGIRDAGGTNEAVRVFWKVFCEEEREGIRNLLGGDRFASALQALLVGHALPPVRRSMEEQGRHLASYLDGVRECGGVKKVRAFWDTFSEKDREGVLKIIGDAGVGRILK